jgi:lysozyme
MMFNLGRPRLGKFKKFNAALEAGDWATAGVEGRDSLWYRQVGNRAERLMERLENV